MQYEIEITDLAEQDMEGVADYIAFNLRNPSAAVSTVLGIRETINTLSQYPERHEVDNDEELAMRGIRRTYYRNYKIYYTVCDNAVKILRILHMLLGDKKCFTSTRHSTRKSLNRGGTLNRISLNNAPYTR